MKKKRKKMLKNIKREKERLEKNLDTFLKKLPDDEKEGYEPFVNFVEVLQGIKVNTKITKKGKIKITNLDNFLLYRIVKVFYFI